MFYYLFIDKWDRITRNKRHLVWVVPYCIVLLFMIFSEIFMFGYPQQFGEFYVKLTLVVGFINIIWLIGEAIDIVYILIHFFTKLVKWVDEKEIK